MLLLVHMFVRRFTKAILFLAIPFLSGGISFFIVKSLQSPATQLRAASADAIKILPQEPFVLAGQETALTEPVPEFKARITKKAFGTFITPETSPVQPDRFKGFHTGIDVEFTDISDDIQVRAITDGTLVLSRFASGYGGVVVIRHEIVGKPYIVLYGHLDPGSMPPTDKVHVAAGEVIGVLGEGFSQETDGARKHLHFSVRSGNDLDIRGYVDEANELSAWIDPLLLYR